MTQKKQVCYVLTGPTASGKTALSIRLAKELDCEIICMDSMQIYRGMNIGTAKPTPEEMDGVPHHLIDVAEPTEPFSVAAYQELAEKKAEEILQRGKKVLFVGGTGFYLRALRHPMAMGVVAGDPVIRQELEARAVTKLGKEMLHEELTRVDPDTAARLPVGDVRRVIRALEVYRLTGLPFSKQPQQEGEAPFRYRVVCTDMDRAILYRRIEQRLDEMLTQGLEEEVRGLLKKGVPADCQAMKAIGYKEMIPYLSGEWDREKMVYELKLNTRHYAKRQLTWMRREEDVCWVDPLQPDAFERARAWFLETE